MDQFVWFTTLAARSGIYGQTFWPAAREFASECALHGFFGSGVAVVPTVRVIG